MTTKKKDEYVIVVSEASKKTPVRAIFGTHPISLYFPTTEAADEYEKAEYDLRLHMYWKLREEFGIFAGNQNRYVNSYSDLNAWDNRSAENRCIVVYGPRGFRLKSFLGAEMKRTVFNRVLRWGKSRVGDFLALDEAEVKTWFGCGDATWTEIKRCQDLYRERYGLPFDLWVFLDSHLPESVRSDLREIGVESLSQFMNLRADMTKAYSKQTWNHVRNAQRRLEEVYGDHKALCRQEAQAPQADGGRKGAGR